MKKILTALLFLSFFASLFAAKTRIACVGDSITDGFGLANPSQDSWPLLLGDMLGEGYEVKNFGQTGKTLQKNGDQSYWDERKYKAALEFNPDIVIIKLGTNDAKEKNWTDPANYKKDLMEFVESFEKLPSKPKIYLGTSAWVRKDSIGITGDRVDNGVLPIQREVAKSKKLEVLDFNGLLRDHPDWYCDDIHPNETGALKMAEFVYAALAGRKAPTLPAVRGVKGEFMGFEKYDFKFRFRDATLILPKKPGGHGKWLWSPNRFDAGNKMVNDYYPALLKRGYYILHTDLDSWLGNPNSVKWGDEVFKYYKAKLGFGDTPTIAATGTGSFYAVNFAASNPERVRRLCLYSPVMDIYEWANSDERNMKRLLQEWRLTPETFGSLKGLSKDNLQKIKDANIQMMISE